MTWSEHPRIVAQKNARQSLLAGEQYRNGWSREEMAEHFRLLAEAKTNGFDNIEAYEAFLDSLKKTENAPEINGGDYALNHYKPQKQWGK